jgi:hypothetical protein
VQLGALDLLKEHRGNDWLPVLNMKRQRGDSVRFSRQKMDLRALVARTGIAHCVNSL